MKPNSYEIKVVKRCPKCNWRIFDIVTPTSGIIELKCPKHRLTRAHREKQLKMSCQALHNAPPNRT